MAITLTSSLSNLNATVKTPTVTTPSTQTTSTSDTSSTPQETVSLGNSQTTDVTYSDPRAKFEAEQPDLATMLSDSDRKVQEFMDYLRPLLEQQGLSIDKVVSGEQKLSADPAAIEKAKADISEDGDLGVRKVAENILNFAKLGIGDDPSKIETFRAAIQKGFDEAQAVLGGTLPDISQQTHKAIMDELDNWEANGIPSGAISLAPAQTTDTTAQTSTSSTTA
jgi:hypothetical protein